MLILMIGVGLNIKNTVNMRDYLAESVKAQTIAISIAAREFLDVENFLRYTDMAPIKDSSYQIALHRLRRLAALIGAKNIHCIRQVGDEIVLVFDTNSDPTSFMPFTLSDIHKKALDGHNAAGFQSDAERIGRINVGAVPIKHNGQVIGAISTDIHDRYIESSYNTALWNSVLFIGILLLTLAVMLYLVIKLLKGIRSIQDKLERQALYDVVTGLPNRQYLWNHLAKVAANTDRDSFALYFIDLDNFKTVNDNAGHDAGDELLKQVAQYLESSTRNAKSFRPSAGTLNIAARAGGDEFVQVVTGLDNAEEAAKVAEDLLIGFNNAELHRFIDKYNVGLSIGIALCPHDTQNCHVLIKYADIAMYQAKRNGKNQYCIYRDGMDKESF